MLGVGRTTEGSVKLIPWPIGSKTLRFDDLMMSVGRSLDFSELLTTKLLSWVAFRSLLEKLTLASESPISLVSPLLQ